MITNKIIILGLILGLVFTGIIVFVDTIYLTDVQAQLTGRNTLYVGGSGPTTIHIYRTQSMMPTMETQCLSILAHIMKE